MKELAGVDGDYEWIASSLAEKDYCVIDNFMTAYEVAALRQVAHSYWQEDEFSQAGIGTAGLYQKDRTVRGDSIRWIDPKTAASPTQKFLDKIEDLQNALNQLLFLSLKEFECHFAIYPPGTFYARHLDQFAGRNIRKISFVLYLNEDWDPKDGGFLRMFVNETIDVIPEAGRLALFRSDVVEHEVVETRRERISITGWMRDRPIGIQIF